MKTWTILLTMLLLSSCGGGSSPGPTDTEKPDDEMNVPATPPPATSPTTPQQPTSQGSVKEAAEYPLVRLIYYLYRPENSVTSYHDTTAQMSDLLFDLALSPPKRTQNDQEIDGKTERTTATTVRCGEKGTITHTIIDKDVGNTDGAGDKTSIRLDACEWGAEDKQTISGTKSIEITRGTLNDSRIELRFEFDAFPGITRFEPEIGVTVSGTLNTSQTKAEQQTTYFVNSSNLSLSLDNKNQLIAQKLSISTIQDENTNTYQTASSQSELAFSLGDQSGNTSALTIDPEFTGITQNSQSLTTPNKGTLTSQLTYAGSTPSVEIKIAAETGDVETVFIQIDGVNGVLKWNEFLLSPPVQSE